MRLAEMSLSVLESRFAEGRRGIILPLGSLEQHGAPGLVGTDTICAEAVADRAADRAGGVSAPVLAYGQTQFHLAAPARRASAPPPWSPCWRISSPVWRSAALPACGC